MRVALVNPNFYLEPPVIPLALEYLAHYLDREGHEIKVIDLSFAGDPAAALAEGLDSFDPQVAGFTLRNVDTSLYHDNVFLLDGAKENRSQNGVVADNGQVVSVSDLGNLTEIGHVVFGISDTLEV